MNRAFTMREKVLLIVLAVLVLGCCYYLVVLRPALDAVSASELQLSAVQDDITIQHALAARKAQLEEQIAEAEASGKTPQTLPAYDNAKNEISELNSILSEASSYNIEFADPEMSGTLVRRSVGITFTADSYAAAQSVLTKLINCKYSCLVSDISISGDSLGRESSTSRVTANVSVTFYEALPEAQ